MTYTPRILSIASAVLSFALLALAPLRLQEPAPHEPTSQKGDIVEVATEAGFDTLVAAVKAAGLVETLKGDGPFTVFAPTDEAFAKLPEGALEDLLKPENKDKLTAILTYHVVPGKVTSTDVVKLNEAETVEGSPLSIEVLDGAVMINDATVTAADVEASNGVIHVIDTVLMPPSDTM